SAGNAHIIGSEGAGAAALGGTLITPIRSPDGRFTADEFLSVVRRPRPRAPRTRLVWIEQTSNAGGGTVWSQATIAEIAEQACERDIQVHMDGARLLNAAVATNLPPIAFTRHCDSAWIDLSKGLGCPIGSVLAGSRSFIDDAWTWKHRLGGAMRQAGVIAAAGLYALDNHVERLAEDHRNARRLADGLSKIDGLQIVGEGVETNIVFIEVSATGADASAIAARVAEHGVRVGPSSEYVLRAVTHLDVSESDIDRAIAAFREAVTVRQD
ncbi:MAG: low specificity L-threonine aldolase, partial [Alphaproteobacteria bacterium]|nr:low specificity L-threonine aldolase [Alphaproteobacteria bacterium]